jgi:hypothetical protein
MKTNTFTHFVSGTIKTGAVSSNLPVVQSPVNHPQKIKANNPRHKQNDKRKTEAD